MAASLASGVSGHLKRGAVGQADATHVKEAGQAFLHVAHEFHESAEPPVVLRLIGQTGKPPREHFGDQAEELSVGTYAHRRLADGKSDQLRVTGMGRTAVGEGDPVVIGEQVCCNNEGFQI